MLQMVQKDVPDSVDLGDLVIVILAGGMGTRLRPFSTDQKPKQFQKFLPKRYCWY